MNRTITLEEVVNGYKVSMEDKDSKKEMVFENTKEFLMLETIGNWLLRDRIKIERR